MAAIVLFHRHPVDNLIPFPPRRRHDTAAYVLALSARWTRVSKTQPWTAPRAPEHLGNMLQLLTAKRPAIVFVLQNVVAEILAELDR